MKDRYARVKAGLQKQGHPCVHNRVNLCALDNIYFAVFKQSTGVSKCEGCIQYEPKIIKKNSARIVDQRNTA